MKIMRNGKQVLLYPSWYDDARKRRAEGVTVNQIADEFGIGKSTASMITSASWKVYLLMWSGSSKDRSLGKYRPLVDQYLFEPRPEDPPSKIMLSKKEKYERAKAYEARYGQAHQGAEVAKIREFKPVSKMHEGKVLKGARIECSKCDASQEYFNYQGTVSNEHLPKEFARRDWLVGKNERTDLCPSCVAKLRGAKLPKTVEKPEPKKEHVPMLLETAAKAEVTKPILNISSKPNVHSEIRMDKPTPIVQPQMADPVAALVHAAKEKMDAKREASRPMDKADRRIVFAKLNEVYGDDMYLEDWIDQKVAEDLGVPVEWVAEVREGDFGPNLNAALKVQVAQNKMKGLTELGEKVERQIMLVEKKLEALEALDVKVAAMFNGIAEQVERFDELTKSLEIEDRHIKTLLANFDTDVDQFKKMFAELKAKPSE
jgi:hypothetical protein